MAEKYRSPLDPNEHQHPSDILQVRMETMQNIDNAVLKYVNESKDNFTKTEALAEQIRNQLESREANLTDIRKFRERVDALEKAGALSNDEIGAFDVLLTTLSDAVEKQKKQSEIIIKSLELEYEMQLKEQQIIQKTLMQMRRLQAEHSGLVESLPESILYPNQQAKNN